MQGSNEHATKRNASIQCVEVSIPEALFRGNDNLYWTLSVYSLENQPVKRSGRIHNDEVFHFMVFDWERTIRELLDNRGVLYSVVQYFNPDTIYSDFLPANVHPSNSEEGYLYAFEHQCEGISGRLNTGVPGTVLT